MEMSTEPVIASLSIVIVPVVERFGLPVKFVGLGESADDLEAFDPEAFVAALLEGTFAA